MYEAYFTRRLLEALTRADSAGNAEEQSVHLRTSRYYRDLLTSREKRACARHPVMILATLRYLGPEARTVTVSDLSSCGFRMELRRPVKPGTLIALEITGLAPIDAYVIWQDGDQLGCKFLSELHPALLEAALAVSPRAD